MRGSVSFAPYDDELKTTLERQGSLLFLRLTAMGERVHPLYLRLDGDVPGVHSKSKVAVYRQGQSLDLPRRMRWMPSWQSCVGGPSNGRAALLAIQD